MQWPYSSLFSWPALPVVLNLGLPPPSVSFRENEQPSWHFHLNVRVVWTILAKAAGVNKQSPFCFTAAMMSWCQRSANDFHLNGRTRPCLYWLDDSLECTHRSRNSLKGSRTPTVSERARKLPMETCSHTQQNGSKCGMSSRPVVDYTSLVVFAPLPDITSNMPHSLCGSL